MNRNLKTILQPARDAVFEVGQFIRLERQSFHPSQVEVKGINDLFSYVDTTSENILMERLYALLPGCGFHNEESGIRLAENEFTWIIDPLDGTTNFIHDIPVYCVSVALQEGDDLVMGFVYDVCHDLLFEARKGEGSFCNHKAFQIPMKTDLKTCVLATGFPQKTNYLNPSNPSLNQYLDLMRTLFMETRGLRRLGAAAVDLAYTAVGRFDGFFEMHLKPWDVAAGGLIVQEAGGVVSDFEGNTDFLNGNSFLAGNPTVHRLILELIQKGKE